MASIYTMTRFAVIVACATAAALLPAKIPTPLSLFLLLQQRDAAACFYYTSPTAAVVSVVLLLLLLHHCLSLLLCAGDNCSCLSCQFLYMSYMMSERSGAVS
jgi:hypothetical protein